MHIKHFDELHTPCPPSSPTSTFYSQFLYVFSLKTCVHTESLQRDLKDHLLEHGTLIAFQAQISKKKKKQTNKAFPLPPAAIFCLVPASSQLGHGTS